MGPGTVHLEPEVEVKAISWTRQTLTIGQLAHGFGLKTSAIRYYERVGVLPEAPRESGQRRYTADTVRQRLESSAVAKRGRVLAR